MREIENNLGRSWGADQKELLFFLFPTVDVSKCYLIGPLLIGEGLYFKHVTNEHTYLRRSILIETLCG